MTLLQFKEHISSFPIGTLFKYGISQPFAWRGSYNEVAFAFLDESMYRDQILDRIEMAYTETFHGWQGGHYRYGDETSINFEDSKSDYTDGGYVKEKIALVGESQSYTSQEGRLVQLAFRLD
jgi:hypothetical protein